MFLVGLVGSHMSLRSYTIFYDPTRSYVRSYHFYDPSVIQIMILTTMDETHNTKLNSNLDSN